MRNLFPIMLLAAAAGQVGFSASRPLLPGDAVRGAAVFQTRGCVRCHSINGQGGKVGPDLGSGTGRGLSPFVLAGLLWNHAPAMWAAMEKSGIPRPELSEQDAADLFVFFYANRYFEQPGNSKRGREVFGLKRCSRCHGIGAPIRKDIKPVSFWSAPADPVALAQQMWDHSSEMRPELERNRVPYPRLSAQELMDVLEYVRRVQGGTRSSAFLPGPADSGRELFVSKGCARCHVGNLKLEARPTRYSLTDFAAALWNHQYRAPRGLPPLTYEEMRRIVGYLISAQFFEERGNIEQGKAVYAKKRCGACHDDLSSGAPPRQIMAGQMTSFGMVAALWRHGPAMLKMMRSKNISWPRFGGSEMADLTTYLRGMQLRRRPVDENPSENFR